LGTGNYRLLLGTTGKEFLDPAGMAYEDRKCLLLSFDQEIGSNWGAWLRLGTQDDAAAITYKNIYSGGINISGTLWGRENDSAGIGYVFLNGGNSGLDNTQVAEAYTRFALNDYLALTLDIQYMNDRNDAVADISGFIYGIRATTEF
jgi:porin